MWGVKIEYIAFQVLIYIYQVRNNAFHMAYVAPDGGLQVNNEPDNDKMPLRPTLQFHMREGKQIMQELAGALAQVGHGTLSVSGLVTAQEKHIASLEKQAERLFELAKD